ncbi:hypothetical protein B0H15DRAFT_796959 [Mycena belliarum]|uniref:Uncharacterized protein n=1 Tax=Mycena belliarum TaxID=1033014 RepID=A0AAD6UF70_9AGAR|nr:hypothetical protein B0H15DRAFT_796959 [Mycena belliae]
MSSEDFSSNNEDPNSTSVAGRGRRQRESTAAIRQYDEHMAKKAASRARRQEGGVRSMLAPLPAAATISSAAGFDQGATYLPQNQPPATYPTTSDHSLNQFQDPNQFYYLNNPQQGSSPNPFQPVHSMPGPGGWDLGHMTNELFAFSNGTGEPPASQIAPNTQNTFNAEEEDEIFGDPDADLPDPIPVLPLTGVNGAHGANQHPLQIEDRSAAGSGANVPAAVIADTATIAPNGLWKPKISKGCEEWKALRINRRPINLNDLGDTIRLPGSRPASTVRKKLGVML